MSITTVQHSHTMNTNERLISLDAFRGFTIAGMILVNNPGDWKAVYPQLLHAPWHGWTFTDWIFPFFLFIGGVSMTLSLGKRAESGANKRELLITLWKRAGIIFLIGLALNLYPRFDVATVRIPGVLQRIALCVALAAPVVLYCRLRGQIIALVAFQAVYVAGMMFVPVPDPQGVWGAGVLEAGRDFGAFIDRALLPGHLWVAAKTWDPEGLFTTLSAVGSQLFGVLAGRWLATSYSKEEKTVWMLLAGLACLFVAVCIDVTVMPINKSLWTSSYCVMMTGWALIMFSVFYWFLDVRPSPAAQAVFKPFVIYGMNALFIFAMSALILKTWMWIKFSQADGSELSLRSAIYNVFGLLPFSPVNISLVYAVCFNLMMFALAWWLWRKRWFIKV